MMRNVTLIFLVSLMWAVSFETYSNAEEIILCVDEIDEEVNLMNARGSCLEDEREFTFSRPGDGDQVNVIPLVISSPNKNCETEGTRTELGFDTDGDGVLDAEEIISISENCKLSPEDE